MPDARLARARRSLPAGYVYRPPQVQRDPYLEAHSAKQIGQYVRDVAAQAQKMADAIDAEGLRLIYDRDRYLKPATERAAAEHNARILQYFVASPQGDGHP